MSNGPPKRMVVPMRARSPEEDHRAATPLELFFDLVFVVAIAQAASGLHHGIADLHVAEALLSYVMVFFAIWWAWMNFTWFASAYDPDDVLYRLTVFVQLTGALILAAGVPTAFAEGDWRIGAIGYVIMRLAIVAQWTRAARSDPDRKRTAYRYAGGVTCVQIAWVALVFGPTPLAWMTPLFFFLIAVELVIPAWAERASPTCWHRDHIAERFGLLTIIVLGESILAATLAMQAATSEAGLTGPLAELAAGALLIVFSMWWFYFYRPARDLMTTTRAVFTWSYGHYLVYAAGAAVGAGLAVNADFLTDHAAIGAFGADMAVAAPVALYLLTLWFLYEVRHPEVPTRGLGPVAVILVLLTPFTGHGVLLTGLILAATLALKLAAGHRAAGRAEGRTDAPKS